MNFVAANNASPNLHEAAKAKTSMTRPMRECSCIRIIGTAALLLAATGAQAQFGPLPVGSMSGNQGVTVTAAVTGTVSSVEVLTLGSAVGDFAVGTGASNCASANLAGGEQCTESVTFKPAAPGLRLGAIVLVGAPSSGSGEAVLGTAYLSGTGTGGLGVLIAGNELPVAGQFGMWTGAVGDGQPATLAELYLPGSVAVDGSGNMYIADGGHNRIRMVCASAASATIQGTSCPGAGIISTIAGDGNPAYTGDGGPAAGATLNNPGYVALDGAGNLYIADSGNNVVRVITAATGVITTIVGNSGGTVCGAHSDAVGDGCPAIQATLNMPEGVTLDGSGNLYIADTNNHRIREVSRATGIITTIAGDGHLNANGTGGYNGDNIAATSAELNFPYAVAFDSNGDMYIPDSANNRIRKVAAAGGVITPASQIVTFAGTGNAGATSCGAEPVAATAADVWSPSGVAVDAAGNVYIAETQNAAIRKVSAASGQISIMAENGCGDFYFDGQFATVELYGPTGLYLDGNGDLYVADTLNMWVQEIQGNFAALEYPTPVFQGDTSAPQMQAIENDGNAALDMTTIAPATNAAIDTTVANSCTNGGTLAVNANCEVGAVFAPEATPLLAATTPETPNIDVNEDSQATIAAPNSPLDIELIGIALGVSSTTTTVSSSPNPSGFGQTVTFTVKVTTGPGTGSLTGTVSIFDTFNGNTVTLASGLALNGSGVAAFALSTLAVGQHSITASYNNTSDQAHTASSSTAEIQSVLEGTSLSLTSSANPSNVGQSITFTATVTSAGGGINPTGTVTFYDGPVALSTQNLNGSGVATYSTSALANGVHQMSATYNGNAGNNVESSTSNTVSQDVQAPSTVGVVSSLNPSAYGATVTLSATVTSSATVAATGTVTFFDGGAQIGTGTLAGSPTVAQLTTSTLVVGTHPITATYAGDSYNSGSSTAQALNQVVNQAQTVTTATAAPSPGIAGTQETITATVQLVSGSAPLAGTVTFTSGTTTLGSAALNGSGTAAVNLTLPQGSYRIVATYGGNANGQGSVSAPLPYLAVLATTETTVTAAPQAAVVLNPITFTAKLTGNGVTPTGTVNILANGTVIGSANLNAGTATFTDSALAAGSYSITAVYLGDANNAGSTSATVNETVGTIPTTTSLGTSATSGSDPQVILVASVLNNDTGPVATGTVTFNNGTTEIGSATLDSTGVATLTPNLNAGVNSSIVAVYSGDADHSPSTSSAVTVSEPATGFNLTLTPSTVTVPTSQNITVTVSLSSNSGFADTIGLGCASLPAGVNCHFSPVSVNLPANGSDSVQLTVDTNNPLGGGASAMNSRTGSRKVSLAGIFLPLSVCFGWIFWRLRRRNASVLTMALFLALSAASLVATGCSSFSQSTASPGTYVIQVTGTGANSDLVHYQNLTLDIGQ
jgi:hypothetical protein